MVRLWCLIVLLAAGCTNPLAGIGPASAAFSCPCVAGFECQGGVCVRLDIGSMAANDSTTDVPGDAGEDQTDQDQLVQDLPVLDMALGDELSDSAPGTGEFGAPCAGHDDCDWGFCMTTHDGQMCSKLCVTDCPAGLACLAAEKGGDLAYLCLPPLLTLCAPCQTNAQCQIQGLSTSRCMALGDQGSYCGVLCAETGDCPAGYACTPGKDVSGASAKQCTPVGGVCACSSWAKAQGAETACSVSNGFGKCISTVKCGSAGLAACKAPVPAAETCDGKDNNCDGKTDEGCPLCGNCQCDKGESPSTCPMDCGSCGDGTCSLCPAMSESAKTCPADCAEPKCGDGKCEVGETAVNCAKDCAAPGCGDGLCDGDETVPNCPQDCGFLAKRLGGPCTKPGAIDTCGASFVCVARGAAGGGKVCVADFATWVPFGDSHPAGDFEDSADHVKDKKTGLCWAKEALAPQNWTSALTACTGKNYGGFVDWRLPVQAELRSLVDFAKEKPACSAPGLSFPSDLLVYWSGTLWVEGGSAWNVFFEDGHNGPYYSGVSYRVRCVR